MRCLLIVVLTLTSFAASVHAYRLNKTFILPDRPSRLVELGILYFEGTDTLKVNGRVLKRMVEYQVSPDGLLSFSHGIFHDGDTLSLQVELVPAAIPRSAGRPLPQFNSVLSQPVGPPKIEAKNSEEAASPNRFDISGAKSFRVFANNSGTSQFGQSLDLSLEGELSPGVFVKGAVSDRGIDPAYGVLNSRINELDRLNLVVTSAHLLARVGDISVQRIPGENSSRADVFGTQARLSYSSVQVGAAIARPKGSFQTVRLRGRDGFQGPYYATGQAGKAVVPGSETVWLDGRQLAKGSTQDYSFDYSLGAVTFSPNYPIDSRSRIEIDFEPLASDFRKELVSAESRFSTKDSAISVLIGFSREGDDKNQLLALSLTENDRQTLNALGDSIAFRTGVLPDTSGSYQLVSDSLPDSVFTYVGKGNGEFSISFSFVGTNNGEYRYRGNNRYDFVGASNGDYLPIIPLPRPVRRDLGRALMTINSHEIGRTELEISGSSLDRNLLSSRDDSDNDGVLLQFRNEKRWQRYDRQNSWQLSGRKRDAAFDGQYRIEQADDARYFLLPDSFVVRKDETRWRGSGTVATSSWLDISAGGGILRREGLFSSDIGELGIALYPSNDFTVRVQSRFGTANLVNSNIDRTAVVMSHALQLDYKLSERYNLSSHSAFDRRSNDYSDTARGLRALNSDFSVGNGYESLLFGVYHDDSLAPAHDWIENADRYRLSIQSKRSMVGVDYDLLASIQQVEDNGARTRNLLTKSTFDWDKPSHGWRVHTGYQLSSEQRNARGITFLEVEPGLGNYLLVNGAYVPDPNGNYIQVEELLSDQTSVRNAEKSVAIEKRASWGEVRLNSNLKDELLARGYRSPLWVIPFVSDQHEPYLYYSRQDNVIFNLMPLGGYYAITLQGARDYEQRRIEPNDVSRQDRTGQITTRHGANAFLLEEFLQGFWYARDEYYVGAGKIEGFKCGLSVKRVISRTELSGGVTLRRADASSNARATTTSGVLAARIVLRGGDIRLSLEPYVQTYSGPVGTASYLLTDNKPGDRGIVWTTRAHIGLKSGVRFDASLSGRYNNSQTGLLTARTELVAEL